MDSDVPIALDPGDPVANAAPVAWALGELRAALAAAAPVGTTTPRITVAGGDAPAAREALSRAGLALPNVPESLGLVPTADGVAALGCDVRGLVYAVLEVADRVRYSPDGDVAAALRPAGAAVEQPACRVRSIARLFSSEIEDTGWWHDRGFWTDSGVVAHSLSRPRSRDGA